MGATRSIALTEWPMRGISINTLAGADADITVVPSDSGVVFVNHYTTETEYTLPAVADGAGKMWWFFDGGGSAATLVTATTACIIGIESTTGTTLTSASGIGDSCMVFGDGTNYYAVIISGTWTTGA